MFQIGEFAQIAQVSGRQLRYYEQLGLLRPARTDPETGYRYYSIHQLPRLNRILALKDLGLTLDQIGGLLEDEVSPTELRGMLAMKRAQLEQSLRVAETQLRHIESRIQQIDDQGDIKDYEIVVKPVAATPYLSMRTRLDGMDEAMALLPIVAGDAVRQIRPNVRGKFIVLSRSTDFDQKELDLEMGFSLTRASNLSLEIAGGHVLTMSELPSIDRMATIIRSGPAYESHKAFGAIGRWMEAHRYEIAGPCREVFLEPITGPPRLDEALIEIQFPIRQAA